MTSTAVGFPVYGYTNITDLVTANDLPAVRAMVDPLMLQYRVINVDQTMQQLTFIGTALHLAYAGSIGFSCCAKIIGIFSAYQGIVKDSQVACNAFVGSSLTALKYHVAALKLADKNPQAALKILAQCEKIAKQMEDLSKTLEEGADKLRLESEDALKETVKDSTITQTRRQEILQRISEEAPIREGLSKTLHSLSTSIEQETERETRARREKNESLDQAASYGTWSPLVSVLTLGIVNLNSNKRVAEQKADQARADELESAKHRRDFERQQRDANIDLAKSLKVLETSNLDKNDLEAAIASLSISTKTLGQIKTTFESVRIFWKTVRTHCQRLQDISVATNYAENDFKDLFIEEIKSSGFNWLSLGKINYQASIAILAASANVDAGMSNLPTKAEAVTLIKREAPRIQAKLAQLYPAIES